MSTTPPPHSIKEPESPVKPSHHPEHPLEEGTDLHSDLDFSYTRPRKRRKKTNKIEIRIHSVFSDQIPQEVEEKTSISSSLDEEMNATIVSFEQEIEDSLAFFEETHEEQDPSFKLIQRKIKEAEIQAQIKLLDQKDAAGRKEIDEFAAQQIKRKIASTDATLQQFKEKHEAEQKNELEKLNMLVKQKNASDDKKLAAAAQLLRERHSAEMQKISQHHQSNANANNPQFQAEFQRLSQEAQIKHQKQMQELQRKAEEIKSKTQQEFLNKSDKIRKEIQRRLQELGVKRNKVVQQLQGVFQQVRQRYMKRHLQKIMKAKEELMEELQRLQQGEDSARVPTPTTARTGATSTTPASTDNSVLPNLSIEDKAEFRQPLPIESRVSWPLTSEPTGSASRHKHRKTIMSQAPRQLNIELHNEGLWVAVVESSGTNNETKTQVEHEFIPYGTRANSVLMSIVCGELPSGYERFDFGEAQTLQGGQLRCVLTDLRASEGSASEQRATAMLAQEEAAIQDLEGKAKILVSTANEAEQALAKVQDEEKASLSAAENAKADVEKAKRMLDEFMSKFRNYFGQGRFRRWGFVRFEAATVLHSFGRWVGATECESEGSGRTAKGTSRLQNKH